MKTLVLVVIFKPKIVIGVHTVDTVEVDAPSISTPNLVCYGCYLGAENRIELKKELPRKKKEETWVHEIIHAIDLNWGIGLTERQVGTLAPAIYLFLVQNGIVK